jgi:hypothetical protein
MTCDNFKASYPQFRFPGPAARLGTEAYRVWVHHLDGCRGCADWYQAEEVTRKGIDLARFPCVHLAYHTSGWCSENADPVACPDVAVIYNPRFDEFGIHLYDRSVLGIRHCPWCGARLPDSRRDEWLRRVRALGIEDPADPRLPDELKSDAWYRNKP